MIGQRTDFARADEYIDFVLNNGLFRPRALRDTVGLGVRDYIFRGQASVTWSLTPAAFRKGNLLADFTPQTAGVSSVNSSQAVGYLGWQLMAELRAVHIFLEEADRLGIPTPIDYSATRYHIEVIQAALNEEQIDYSQPFPDPRILPSLALAQHYGVPTRLLDWTESPLVAAYFAAVPHSSVAETALSNQERFAIYALDTRLLYSDDEFSVTAAPRHMNPNLRAQKGVFTYLPKANAYFARTGHWHVDR